MNVDKVSSVMHQHHHRQLERKTERQQGDEAEAAVQSATASEKGEKQQGVLRLLEEGHFKGVAELRLRIRFHEELQNRQQTRTANALEESFGEIKDILEDGVESLTAGLADNEETAAGIKKAGEDLFAALQQTREDYLKNDAATPEELAITLGEQLASFVAQVNSLLTPPSEEEVAADVPSPDAATAAAAVVAQPQDPNPQVEELAEPTPEETTSVVAETESDSVVTTSDGDPVADIQQALLAEVDRLVQNLQSVALPPLSEPHGHGRAYAKFLEIYEQLQNSPVTEVSSEPVAAVDQNV